jgi:hypothetical protein
LVRRLRSSSQRMKPYWSAGAKTANAIAAIANGVTRRMRR